MYIDIVKFYEDCLICKKAGRQTINTKNKVIETSIANELWEIDHMGRLSDRGKCVCCCLHRSFTKWTETKVIRHKTAEEVIKAFEELIIEKHGVPERILSDSGL
ncbi:hypothetical protein NGRA_3030 [Nosema granulosis]|uniref:Integrase catalytic domain-containing protein n=1 Tax=Nosema granulosis TaxID=83296 RepID=A0A9P6GVH5_9MICR|nr:hypothetical protein NGRA_3030 [Nosema granulosis]